MVKQSAYQFFKAQAGYSYTPGKETPEQGRRRCARSLAQAEQWAQKNGVEFHIDYDQSPDVSWMDSQELADYESGELLMLDAIAYTRCECCNSRKVSASLGSISVRSFDDPYLRVIKAELASEIKHEKETSHD